MTAPALPGAAPDPARLPPDGAIDAAALGQLADTMRRAIDCGCVNVGVHPATFLALVDLAARALGGDGEPVAWEIIDKDGVAIDRPMFRSLAAAEAMKRECEMWRYRSRAPFTVAPLYTRPAALAAVEAEREACARIVRAFREQYEPGDDARLTLEQAEQDICARGAKS